MSTIVDIADAIVSSLNAAPFVPPLQARRRYQPVFELRDLVERQVTVVPKSVTIANATRVDGYFDCVVDVGVQQRIATETDLDDLIHLVEAIADHLRQERLVDAPYAAFVSLATDPIYVSEHLDQQRVFTSVLTVTYRVRR